MSIIDPKTPIYNAIIIYILIVALIVVMKPNFLYNMKTSRMKTFGCINDQTLIPFPILSVILIILIQPRFSIIETLSIKFENK